MTKAIAEARRTPEEIAKEIVYEFIGYTIGTGRRLDESLCKAIAAAIPYDRTERERSLGKGAGFWNCVSLLEECIDRTDYPALCPTITDDESRRLFALIKRLRLSSPPLAKNKENE